MIISNKKDEIYYHFIALHAKGTQDQEVVIRRHCSRQSVLHDALALALALASGLPPATLRYHRHLL